MAHDRTKGDITTRLTAELDATLVRLRELVESTHDEAAVECPQTDPFEDVRSTLDHEIGLATRSLLHERANRLAEALDRVQAGAYGRCEECGEQIAPRRLAALPEVTTCVRCQDRRERRSRRRCPDTGLSSITD